MAPPLPDVNQQMALAQQRMRQEMPAEMAGASITPGTGISGMMMPKGAYATTWPLSGNITYSPTALGGQNQDFVENTLAHELTHRRQIQQAQQQPLWQRAISGLQGLFGPSWQYPIQPGEKVPDNYQPNPLELEAFQTEADRTLSHHLPSSGDIQLFGLRKAVR